MKVKYQYHEQRRKDKLDLMIRIVTDYNGGMTGAQIAKRYRITRAWVYRLLKDARTVNPNLKRLKSLSK